MKSTHNNKLVKSLEDLDFIDSQSKTKVSCVFSPRTGIINALLKREELAVYRLYMYQSLSANITTLFNRRREVSSGGLGVAFSEKDAFWGCIGETVERYCISYYDSNTFIYKELKDLPAKHRLDKFDFYSQEQYKNDKCFSDPNRVS